MRRPLGVLAGLVSAAALCAPVTAAEAATATTAAEAANASQSACRVTVTKPRLSGNALTIVSSAARRGCFSRALVRIRVQRAVPGPDPVVKSGATRNGRITLTLPCAPGTYYATVTDYRGGTAKSRPVRLTCTPTTPAPGTPTPTPTGSSTPTSTPTSSPTTSAPPSGGTVGTAEENEVLRLTNAERAKAGCGALKHDPQLRAAASGHSAEMARRGKMDHNSADGSSFMDRIRAAGFTGGSAFAENIAEGYTTPSAVVQGWMNSSGHRANILNCRYTLIGIGAAKNAAGRMYWTQDFAAR
ncbi:CAP domain-containing protein [Nonomuraea sp. NPDC050783]|uniref:CAP domain-containing protein n=1 Tax=Nonomuraea sp. NPDC050783 TaxID=3154634 RepID=UPI003467297E